MYFACRSWQWFICDTSSFLLGWPIFLVITCRDLHLQLRIKSASWMFSATFAENRFPTVGRMSDIGPAQNSKAPVATRRRRRKWSCWQPGVVTWQRPCSREVFHMDIEVPPCVVRNRKFAKYVHGLENMYPAHIFCKFCKICKICPTPGRVSATRPGVPHIFYIF